MISVADLLKEGARKVGRADALWLLSALLKQGQAKILLNLEHKISTARATCYKEWLRRRLKGEPMQYICGLAPFWEHEFKVKPGVLIPRPETERLVEIILQLGDKIGGAIKIFDVGSGSGCIGISLKLARPQWQVAASDPSAIAMTMSRANARRLGAPVLFFRNYFLNPIIKASWPRPDIIVSNPPYLDAKKDKIEKDVWDWEPREAILSDQSGCWHAEQIFAQSCFIIPKFLVLELSPRVAASLEKKWRHHKSVFEVRREADLTGRKRFLLVRFKHG